MSFDIRLAEYNDLEEINLLVEKVFDQFVASEYSKEGVQEFKRYIDLDLIRARFNKNHIIYIAKDSVCGHIVGMLEIRNQDHISLFFVDKEYMGQNIGRSLSDFAFEKCSCEGKSVITVNSSLYAVDIYIKLGFTVVGEEEVINGIRFIPMSKTLNMDC